MQKRFSHGNFKPRFNESFRYRQFLKIYEIYWINSPWEYINWSFVYNKNLYELYWIHRYYLAFVLRNIRLPFKILENKDILIIYMNIHLLFLIKTSKYPSFDCQVWVILVISLLLFEMIQAAHDTIREVKQIYLYILNNNLEWFEYNSDNVSWYTYLSGQ